MAQSAVDKIPPSPKLDALTAEKVFGWKNVHQHEGSLVGKKQDKAGHWRLGKVPYFSTNPIPGIFDRGPNEATWAVGPIPERTAKITRAKDIPSDWATPDQRCRAAIKAVGQYGKVISLSGGSKQIQK